MPTLIEKPNHFIVIFLLIVVIYSCGFASPCQETEAQRSLSPDGKVEAILVKKNCGATTSESFNVFIVAIGNNAKKKDLIFKADHLDGFTLSWRDSRFLEIKYKQARIFYFMNFWQSKDVDNYAYVVEVRETPLSESHSLNAADRWEK
jgi:hypothetical protein